MRARFDSARVGHHRREHAVLADRNRRRRGVGERDARRQPFDRRFAAGDRDHRTGRRRRIGRAEDIDGDAVDARPRRRLRDPRGRVAVGVAFDDDLRGAVGQEERGRPVEDAIAYLVALDRPAIAEPHELRHEDVLGAEARGGGRWELPMDINPADGRVHHAVVPVEDARRVRSDVRVPLDRRGDHAVRLARADDEVVGRAAVAARDARLVVAGVAHAVAIGDGVAAAGDEAVAVHFDDGADALDLPLDGAVAEGIALGVVDGREHDVLGADAARRFERHEHEGVRLGIEVGVVAR